MNHPDKAPTQGYQASVVRYSVFFLVLALVWGGFWLLHHYDWEHGVVRGGLLLGFLLLLGINRRIPGPEAPQSKVQTILWSCLYLIVGAWLATTFWHHYHRYNPGDIGRSTVTMIQWFFESGLNPYTTPIDDVAQVQTGFKFYNGYKYFPLTIFFYAPFVEVWGAKGLYVGNLLLIIACSLAMYRFCTLIFRASAAISAGSIVLFVTAPFLIHESLRQAVNDLIAVTLVMAAMVAYATGRERLAGVLLGLSLSSKYLPGLLLVPLIASVSKRKLQFLLMTGLPVALIVGPFFLWAPAEFIGTIVLFYFHKAPDSTSIAYYLPAGLRGAWTILGLGLLAGMIGWYVLRAPKLATTPLAYRAYDLLTFFPLVCITFCLFAGSLHRNYLVWFLPFAAIALSELAVKLAVKSASLVTTKITSQANNGISSTSA